MKRKSSETKPWFMILLVLAIVLSTIFVLVKGIGLLFFVMLLLFFIVLFFIYFFRSKFVVGQVFTVIISIFFVIIFLITFLYTKTSDTNNIGKTNTNISVSKCKAINLKVNNNDDATIQIVNSSDVFHPLQRHKYNIDELEGLSYGYSIKENDKGFYAVLELCKGDKSISHTRLNTDMFHKADPKLGPNTAGNYENFSNIPNLSTLDTGEYNIYLYISDNGNKWYIAKTLDIELQ